MSASTATLRMDVFLYDFTEHITEHMTNECIYRTYDVTVTKLKMDVFLNGFTERFYCTHYQFITLSIR